MLTCAVIIIAFHADRFEKFLTTFQINDPSICDFYIVHNLFEPTDIKNRCIRNKESLDKLNSLISKFQFSYILVERDNIGEDLGAQRHMFMQLKDKYDVLFFLNEAAIINDPLWLEKTLSMYSSNSDIVSCSPQVCRGIQFPYCMPTTYWSVRTNFKFEWPEPRSRQDSENQEMTLIWPQAKKQGKFIAQVGKGDLISYKNMIQFPEGVY